MPNVSLKVVFIHQLETYFELTVVSRTNLEFNMGMERQMLNIHCKRVNLIFDKLCTTSIQMILPNYR